MKVTPVEGERSVYLVESRTLQCPYCARKYRPDNSKRHADLKVGLPCPHCGTKLKRMLPHRVDLLRSFPIGECGCWQGTKGRELRKTELVSMSEDDAHKMRCAHTRAARGRDLNRRLWQESRGEIEASWKGET